MHQPDRISARRSRYAKTLATAPERRQRFINSLLWLHIWAEAAPVLH